MLFDKYGYYVCPDGCRFYIKVYLYRQKKMSVIYDWMDSYDSFSVKSPALGDLNANNKIRQIEPKRTDSFDGDLGD